MWLHVAKIPGPDGSGAWLVVPGIEDRIFNAAIAGTPAAAPIRWLPTFGGWYIPLASEHVLWSVVAATHGDGIVCRQCLFGDMPCEAWIHLVEKRFDEAAKHHQRELALQNQQLVWLQGQQPQPRYQPVVPIYPNYPRPQSQPPRETRHRWQPPPFESHPPRHQPPPPPRTPGPPTPTREQRIEAAVLTLKLSWPATRAQITKAFRIAALKAHPDLGGTDAAMRAVIEARDTLLKAA